MDKKHKIEEFVAELHAGLPAIEPTRRRRRHLRVVVRACGYKNVRRELLEALDEALSAARIAVSPSLLGPDLRPDTVLTFSRTPIVVDDRPRLRFRTERALGDFLVENFRYIAGLDEFRRVHREYRLPSGQRIDLLFEAKNGELVVTELKLGYGGRETVAEAFDYVAELRQTPAGEHRTISVLIVTAQPRRELFDDLAAMAAEHHVSARWLTYEISMTLDQQYPSDAEVGLQAPAAGQRRIATSLAGPLQAPQS
jgi:hypothetical protein